MVDTKQDSEDDWKELVTDVDGFYNEETQPIVRGKVVSITEMVLARRETMVAVLLLTAPCKAVTGSKDEKKVLDLEVGQAIGVVIKHKLADMPSFLENQCEVEIKAKNKIDLDNGNSLWRYAIRFRGRRAGLAVASAKPSAPSPKSEGSTKDPEASAKGAMEQF
jgi:hypothetical protein